MYVDTDSINSKAYARLVWNNIQSRTRTRHIFFTLVFEAVCPPCIKRLICSLVSVYPDQSGDSVLNYFAEDVAVLV